MALPTGVAANRMSGRVAAGSRSTDALAFFGAVRGAFDIATLQTGCVDRFFEIAGQFVRLRFAGDALVQPMTAALTHLAIQPPTNPALDVLIWDSVSTRSEMPPPPWSWDDYAERGQVRGFGDARMTGAFHYGAQALSLLDADANLAIYWLRDARLLPYYESGAPLLTILSWWMRRHARQLVHAACVGNERGGALLVGRGGVGKSTTTLACLDSPLVYLADDYCLVSTDDAPQIYSLYSTGKVDAAGLEKFPRLAPALENVNRLATEKALFFLGKHFPDKIARALPLRVILIPRIIGRDETTLEPASPADALKALAPSTIFQLADAGVNEFHLLGKIVRRAPCYHLNLGTDLAQIPRVILGLLNA